MAAATEFLAAVGGGSDNKDQMLKPSLIIPLHFSSDIYWGTHKHDPNRSITWQFDEFLMRI
jgi:hypothetical protein